MLKFILELIIGPDEDLGEILLIIAFIPFLLIFGSLFVWIVS